MNRVAERAAQRSPGRAAHWRLPIALALVANLTSCEKHIEGSPKAERGALVGARSVSPRKGTPADDGQWTLPGKDYENTRFSSLEQISTRNVGQLRLVWTQSTGAKRGHEAAPLAVGDSLFVVTPFPNHLLAFDLKAPGSPPKWQYTPATAPAAAGVACCDVVNRGASYADGRIFFNTLD